MTHSLISWRAAALAAVVGLAPSGGAAFAQSSMLDRIFNFGGAAPAAKPGEAPPEEVTCPQVDVPTGGAALTTTAGAGAVRSQISLANFARECTPQPDGSVVVKIGVEGRALLGPGGSAGRLDAPLRFILKTGETVIASRAKRVPVTIPSGETQAGFTVVEEGFVVPKQHAQDFAIEVALGAGAPEKRAPRRERRPG
jgi:hypothetical protein